MEKELQEYLQEMVSDRRERIRSLINQTVVDQRYALIAVGAFWSWYLAENREINSIQLRFLPIVIACFFLGKWIAIDIEVRRNLARVRQIEDAMGHRDVLKDILPQREGVDWLATLSTVFWICMLLANIIFGIAG